MDKPYVQVGAQTVHIFDGEKWTVVPTQVYVDGGWQNVVVYFIYGVNTNPEYPVTLQTYVGTDTSFEEVQPTADDSIGALTYSNKSYTGYYHAARFNVPKMDITNFSYMGCVYSSIKKLGTSNIGLDSSLLYSSSGTKRTITAATFDDYSSVTTFEAAEKFSVSGDISNYSGEYYPVLQISAWTGSNATNLNFAIYEWYLY